jgi:hypothetical protein
MISEAGLMTEDLIERQTAQIRIEDVHGQRHDLTASGR